MKLEHIKNKKVVDLNSLKIIDKNFFNHLPEKMVSFFHNQVETYLIFPNQMPEKDCDPILQCYSNSNQSWN